MHKRSGEERGAPWPLASPMPLAGASVPDPPCGGSLDQSSARGAAPCPCLASTSHKISRAMVTPLRPVIQSSAWATAMQDIARVTARRRGHLLA